MSHISAVDLELNVWIIESISNKFYVVFVIDQCNVILQ